MLPRNPSERLTDGVCARSDGFALARAPLAGSEIGRSLMTTDI
jgi:hypothetical protein